MSLTRKQQILKIIVEDFIRTAKPIGSKYLIEKYNLPYSSATIRNDMQALENEGLIEKTHISSGRVPSANGYKYYVNNLRTSTVDNKFKNELKTIFDSSKSVEDILRESCAILSHMTNLTSVVLGPKADNERLINIHLVPINDTTCTVLFVTDSGYVENKTFIISKKNKMQNIVKCLKLLDERLKGTKVKDLVEKLKEMKPILEGYMNDYSNLYNALLKLFYEFASNRSEVIGKSNLLKQPEFSGDAQEIQKILGLFDDPIKLEEIINQANEQLLINDSNDENSNVSIVSKEIVIPGENSVGKIAVIGPKRMDYDKVINYLDYIVSEILAHMNK